MSDTNWARSSFWRDGDACIEVCRDGGAVRIRDGELGDDSRELVWSVERWAGLLGALTRGEDTVEVLLDDDGGDMWFGARGDDSLLFTAGAWNSFVAGVKAGEFDVEKLSTPVPVSEGSQVSGEEGPAVERPNLAATGAGAAAVPPVPVAAQQEISDELIRVQRERDSLARRLGVRWGELEEARAALRQMTDERDRWRTEADTLTDQIGDMRATVSAAEADRDAVAAQPRYVLDVEQIMGLVERYADAYATAQILGVGVPDELRDAIRAALTPVPDVEPEPRWGSGPLVDHNPETPAPAAADIESAKYPRFSPQADLLVDAHNGPERWTGQRWNDYVAAAERSQSMVTARLLEVDERAHAPGTGSADPDGGQ